MALEKASWKRWRLSLSWQDEQHVGHSRWQKGLSQGVEKRQRGGRSGRSRRREESGRLRGPGAEPGLGSARLRRHREAIEGLCPGQPRGGGRNECLGRRCRPLSGLPRLPALTGHATCATACRGLGDIVVTLSDGLLRPLSGVCDSRTLCLFVSLGRGAGLGASRQPDGSDPSLRVVVRPRLSLRE